MDSFVWPVQILNKTNLYGNLYFAVLKNGTKPPSNTHNTMYFNVDNQLLYYSFNKDFGPLNLSCLFKYCIQLNTYMTSKKFKRVVHFAQEGPNKQANSAYLIGSYCVIFLNMNPEEVVKKLEVIGLYRPFLDASKSSSCEEQYIHLRDCLNALSKCFSYNFVNFADFNSLMYDNLSRFHCGEMNWILSDKFLAFAGPNDNGFMYSHPPQFFLEYFLLHNIKTVVRLNDAQYDAKVFKNAGIEHYALFFPDGTCPPKDVLLKFLEIAENSTGAIAVHCKAGLGRTGALIGAYLVKHFKLTAREAIAWLRICRPGSVFGPQQIWLEKNERRLWNSGHFYRLKKHKDAFKITPFKYGIYSYVPPNARETMIEENQRIIHGNSSLITNISDDISQGNERFL